MTREYRADREQLNVVEHRKDMDEMSFAFRVTQQDWDNDYTHRTIRALTLQKGDVSVVNYGMNCSATTILTGW